MTSDGSSTILLASYGGDFGQLLGIFFLVLTFGSAVIAGAVALLGNLRDPLRETNRSERRDARTLRKENIMPMWAQLANVELAWRNRLRYFKRYHATPRHARPKRTAPQGSLEVAIYRRQAAENAGV